MPSVPPSGASSDHGSAAVERALWGGLIAVVVLIAAFGGLSLLGAWVHHEGVAAPPVYRKVPDFSLVERSGDPVQLSDLSGKIWIADFIFTRCHTLCPLMSQRMSELQRRLHVAGDPRLRLVSFSVDPQGDTPPVLRTYADGYGADAKAWLFLTGRHEDLYRLIGSGFQLAVAQRAADGSVDPNDLITHSDRFVLVDGQAQIRGYYESSDPDAMARLLRDVELLRKES